MLAIGDGLGNRTSFTYVTLSPSQVESLASIQQPLGGLFTYTYNSNGQVSTVVDQLGNTTSLVWNSSGLRSVAIDPQGNRTSYSYNSFGQITAVQNPLGQIVTAVYNSVGQQTAIINPLGHALVTPTMPTVSRKAFRTRSARSRRSISTRSIG